MTPKPLVPFVPASKAQLQVQGITITHHIPLQLCYLCSMQATKQYLCHRYSWNALTFDLVDWNLFRSSFLASDFNFRLFVIKWTNHLHPPGYRQHRRINQHHSPSCPLCEHPHEDDHHLLHCSRASKCSLISDVQSRLTALFDRRHVDPTLRTLIRHAFLILLDPDHPDEPPEMLPDSHCPLFLAQQSIGWDHLFYGHFSTDWTKLQHSYLKFVKKPCNQHQAASFFKELTSDLWALVHSIWIL
jgi:hypothetical protein